MHFKRRLSSKCHSITLAILVFALRSALKAILVYHSVPVAYLWRLIFPLVLETRIELRDRHRKNVRWF